MATNTSTLPAWLTRWGQDARTSFLTLAVLAALPLLSPLLPDAGPAGALRFAVEEGRGRNPLWWIDLRQANTGYYESLMSDSSDPSVKSNALLSRAWALPESPHFYKFHPYRIYTGEPNIKAAVTGEGPVSTNSLGLFDVEHTLAHPAGVRRVAVFGDSLTRGWGVELPSVYPRLIEQDLNRKQATGGGEPFEFINFSESAYLATQLLDVALASAPAYKPDVYMLVLSELAVSPKWSGHIATLVRERRDLKYPFLKQVASEAGVTPQDSPDEANRKLAPYRLRVLRTVVEQIKAQADHDHAGFLIVLISAAEDSHLVRLRFGDTLAMLKDTGVPVVDLLDTFDKVKDIESVRSHWYDAHPNALGHKMLAENFVRKARSEPDAWRVLAGQP